jgi:hypothetical protein
VERLGAARLPGAPEDASGARVEPAAWRGAVAAAPGARRRLLVAADGCLQTFDLERGEVARRAALPEHAGRTAAVAVLADGRAAAVACDGGSVFVVDLDEGRVVAEARAAGGHVGCLGRGRDEAGREALFAGGRGRIVRWTLPPELA